MRRIRYREIADDAASARRRRRPAGSLLPSEAELSAEFGASRVTIRRALDVLRDDGLVAARQGFGWFVAAEPVRQHLGQLGTIEAQLAGSGIANERRVVEFAFDEPPDAGAPAARRRLRAPRQAGQPRRRRAVRRRHGVVPGRARPAPVACRRRAAPVLRAARHHACAGRPRRSAPTAASADEARLLRVPVGAPLLKCQRVTTDESGHAGAGQRAPLPRPSHRVRRRLAGRRAVDAAERAAPRRVDDRRIR